MTDSTIDLRPVNRWLLISREPGAERIGEIIVPNPEDHISEIATVAYADPDSEFRPNQRIVLASVSGHRMTVGDRDLWVVRPDEVVAVWPADLKERVAELDRRAIEYSNAHMWEGPGYEGTD